MTTMPHSSIKPPPPFSRPANARILVCAVPDCRTRVDDAIFCHAHTRKIGKQRLLRVFMWRDRLRASRDREAPAHQILKQHFEYALQSATQQAAGKPRAPKA